jgi:hypothetical protein
MFFIRSFSTIGSAVLFINEILPNDHNRALCVFFEAGGLENVRVGMLICMCDNVGSRDGQPNIFLMVRYRWFDNFFPVIRLRQIEVFGNLKDH